MLNSILDFLNPVSFWKNVSQCYKDVINYRFYRKTITKLTADGSLKEKGMRADTLKRVYFVINLLPETLLAGSDVELLERSRVTEAIAERNQVFMKDGLLEIIEADYRRIKTAEYYAYLVWIKYRWESKISTWFKTVLWISLLVTIAVNYQIGVTAAKSIWMWYQQINN
jgi:hypothetical protein